MSQGGPAPVPAPGVPAPAPVPPEGNVQGGDNIVEDEIPEFVGSEVVTRDTRTISQNLVEILTDTDARQWDDGRLRLANGYQFNLWSQIHPEPVEHPHESMDAFIARQRQARLNRLTILANRAQRTLDARRAHDEAFPTPSHPAPLPPVLSSPDATTEADDRFKKQLLLNQLANRVAEDITDPLDKTMFEYLDRVEAQAARAAFQKVLNSPGGLAVLTDEAGLEESHNWSGAIAATFQTAGGRQIGRQYRQMPALIGPQTSAEQCCTGWL